MAGQKFLANVSGFIKEIFSIQSSTGAPDAGKIPALDAAGRFDISMMPVGVGAEVVVALASENLAAGDMVNFHLSGGVLKIRKADASTNGKPANGFVTAAVTSGNNATAYLVSNINASVSGLTIGSDYFLGTTPGLITDTPPSSSGNIVQRLGKAKSATELIFENEFFFELS